MYRVSRVLNNNGVIAIDMEDNQEYVLLGKGLGFGKKVSERFEKPEGASMYRLADDTERGSAKSLARNVAPEFIEMADAVMREAESRFGTVDRRVMLPLADHLSFAASRVRNGEQISNPLTDDIRTLFHSEFKTALLIKDLFRDRLGLSLIHISHKEKEVSALSALIAFFVMNTAINAMLQVNGKILADGTISADVLEGTITSVCGIQSLQMGVFGGIIVGLGVAALHNRFHMIELPNALSFFGGSRFVPIISTVVYMFVGILMYFAWPVVQNGIYALGGLVTGLSLIHI